MIEKLVQLKLSIYLGLVFFSACGEISSTKQGEEAQMHFQNGGNLVGVCENGNTVTKTFGYKFIATNEKSDSLAKLCNGKLVNLKFVCKNARFRTMEEGVISAWKEAITDAEYNLPIDSSKDINFEVEQLSGATLIATCENGQKKGKYLGYGKFHLKKNKDVSDLCLGRLLDAKIRLADAHYLIHATKINKSTLSYPWQTTLGKDFHTNFPFPFFDDLSSVAVHAIPWKEPIPKDEF